jgi:hypothetical protein
MEAKRGKVKRKKSNKSGKEFRSVKERNGRPEQAKTTRNPKESDGAEASTIQVKKVAKGYSLNPNATERRDVVQRRGIGGR